MLFFLLACLSGQLSLLSYLLVIRLGHMLSVVTEVEVPISLAVEVVRRELAPKFALAFALKAVEVCAEERRASPSDAPAPERLIAQQWLQPVHN